MAKPSRLINSFLVATVLSFGIPSIGTEAIASGGGGGGGGSVGGSSAPQYDPVVEYQKGVDALNAKDFRNASKAFGRVLKVARKDANSNYLMGVAQTGLEKHKRAIKYYKNAARYNPDLLKAYPAMAQASVLAGKDKDAQTALSMITEQVEECGDCANAAELAKTKAEVESILNGENVQQQSFLMPNVKLAKADGVQYFDAVSLINQKRYEEAIEDLHVLSVEIGPHPDVMNYLGYAHRKLGQFDRAEQFYGVALSVDDKHRGANEYLGELYVETGQYEKAHIQLKKLENICSFGCIEEDELRGWINKAAW